MSAESGLRLFMVVVGLVILGVTIISLARKQLTESFCIAWGVVSAVFIIAGIILKSVQWNRYVSWNGMMLVLFSVLILLFGAFYFSVRVSRLTREVRELVIQVSLLNQENELILRELTYGHSEAERQADEEALICH